MFLVSTSHKLELVLSGAITTNQLHFYVSYSDHTTSSFTPGATSGTSNNTTPVDLVSAPAAATQRQINYISIYNNDTTSATVTVRNDDGTNERILIKITLQTNETLEYHYENGWMVINNGVVKNRTITHLIGRPVSIPHTCHTGTISATTSIVSGFTIAMYLGRAPKVFSSCSIQYRVTTGGASVTWAEIAIGKGSLSSLSSGISLDVIGYTDVATEITSIATHTTAITISDFVAGDDLWFMYGNQATTVPLFRAYSYANNLTLSTSQLLSVRPSNISPERTFVASTNTLPWIVAVFS